MAEYDVYCYPPCGKIELFAAKIGQELRGQDLPENPIALEQTAAVISGPGVELPFVW